MPSCCELPKSQLRLVTGSALALLLSPLCSCMLLTICPPNFSFFFLWCLPPSFSHSLQGYVGPSQEQVLKVFYLPGVPGAFCRTFQIQVGHLEPETITLKGEGSFPRICLDLPRNIRGELCLSIPRKVPWFPPVLYTHRVAVAHLEA